MQCLRAFHPPAKTPHDQIDRNSATGSSRYLKLKKHRVFFLKGLLGLITTHPSIRDQAKQLQREVLHVVQLLEQRVHVARGSLRRQQKGVGQGSQAGLEMLVLHYR